MFHLIKDKLMKTYKPYSDQVYWRVVNILRIFFKAMMHHQLINSDKLTNLPANRPIIIAPQHLTNWDPFLIGCLIPFKIAPFAKESLFKIPLVGKLFSRLGAKPIDRTTKDHRKSLKQTTDMIELLRQGENILMFPGGTRHATEVKNGVGDFALKSGALIIPISIDYPAHWLIFYFGRAKITIHDFIDASVDPYKNLDRKQLSQTVWEIITKR